jgi:RNA polymerase sigma factor (sigma-70 family)
VSAPSDLTHSFEASRGQLQSVAYRMLGSLSDAEDAVQETWLRLDRSNVEEVQNLGGWLRTVVSRVCLDMLRSRASRREDLTGDGEFDGRQDPSDPEQEAIMADSVGNALLVVLDRLEPAERVAFVLHDMFAVPFDEIAPIVERSPATTKKLASRARQKVQGPRQGIRPVSGAELARRKQIIEDFLAAAREGHIEGVLAVLAPDVVRRADVAALQPGRPTAVRGARAVAEEIAVFGRNAQFAELVLIDGTVGFVIAPRGRLQLAVTVTIDDGKITGYELIADPARLRRLDLAVLRDLESANR